MKCVSYYTDKGMRQSETMQEFDPDQLEQQIAEAQDPDLLKELMSQAIHAEREDLVEMILEQSIRTHRLVEKLQDYQMQPGQTTQISFLDDDETDDEAETEEPPSDPYS